MAEGGHDGPPPLRRKSKRRPAVRGAASGAHFQVLAFLTFAASSAVWKRFLAFFLLCPSSSSTMRTTSSSLSLLLLSSAA